MNAEVTFNGLHREGSVDLSLDGARVVADVFSVLVDGIGGQDIARVEATPDQAEAIGRAFLEWAALARSRQHANAPLPLFGFLP